MKKSDENEMACVGVKNAKWAIYIKKLDIY